MVQPPEPPRPLGPDSLTWRYFGEWVAFAFTGRATLLQVMDPSLGAGVAEHSAVFDEPFQRLWRSLFEIFGVVYDGPAAATTAATVRDHHVGIKGSRPDGARYHALDPATFYWAHATFVEGVRTHAETFHRRLRDDELDRLHAEGVQWWRLYGMSMRPVPADRRAFESYFAQHCAHVLQLTPAARRLVAAFHDPPPPPGLRGLPAPVWRVLRWPAVRLHWLLTVGTLPPAARETLGEPWTPARAWALRLVLGVLRALWRLPRGRWRYHPRAMAAFRRAAGVAGPVELPQPPSWSRSGAAARTR
ncbi:DUF2236 domain-containing protein [Pseudonocardia bannensis]|uniref:DUF2236 domain-containing protein n=1 Tax=Pseudonocardia bannensis TaxID=630973 RepID=A0A848DD69_9PSEU|nr:oxygenase MpaB family protein [Pseudonocardia bannensis]NMH90507.1 DUF2236 domain-containing protein [Pseudonocardia bannensis]